MRSRHHIGVHDIDKRAEPLFEHRVRITKVLVDFFVLLESSVGASEDIVTVFVFSDAVPADDQAGHLRRQLIHLGVQVLPFEEG